MRYITRTEHIVHDAAIHLRYVMCVGSAIQWRIIYCCAKERLWRITATSTKESLKHFFSKSMGRRPTIYKDLCSAFGCRHGHLNQKVRIKILWGTLGLSRVSPHQAGVSASKCRAKILKFSGPSAHGFWRNFVWKIPFSTMTYYLWRIKATSTKDCEYQVIPKCIGVIMLKCFDKLFTWEEHWDERLVNPTISANKMLKF